MSLYSPSLLTTTIAHLTAAGIAIVRHDEGWFIEDYDHVVGPYTTPELALEASARWLTERQMKQVGGLVADHPFRH